MTDKLPPACVTCIYHRVYDGALTFHYCDNPRFQIENFNPVTGDQTTITPYCYDLREKNAACGPEGHGWIYGGEPVPPVRKSLWWHFKNFLNLLSND